jgi:hypothetical protein
MADESLYDEFGNYIGPALASDQVDAHRSICSFLASSLNIPADKGYLGFAGG